MAAAAFGSSAMRHLAPAGQRTSPSNRRATLGRTLTIVRRFAFRGHDGKMKSWKENRNRRKLYFFRKRKSPPMITGRHCLQHDGISILSFGFWLQSAILPPSRSPHEPAGSHRRARSDGDMRVAPGYRGAPWAKPRTDHIADAPLIRATAVNVAAGTLNWKTLLLPFKSRARVLVGSAARYMCHPQRVEWLR